MKAVFALLCLSVAAFAQSAIQTTTLSSALVAPLINTTPALYNTVYVASTTGMQGLPLGSTPSAALTFLVVDREAMPVINVVNSTTVQVSRGSVSGGAMGTIPEAHASGTIVYFGPASNFVSAPQSGTCTAANYPYLPLIQTGTGYGSATGAQQWNCIGSLWTAASPTHNAYTVFTATPGTVRANTSEIFTNLATMTSGNIVGDRGAATIAAATTVSGGFVYGGQAKLVILGTVASGATVTAGISQWDASSATAITGGANSVHWFDLGQTATGSLTTTNMLRITNTTSATVNSFATIYGNATYLFEFGNPSGAAWLSATTSVGSQVGRIAVHNGASTVYIPLYAGS